MASVDRLPAYLLPGVPVVQPPHLEGDATLATEILPGPPPLISVQQASLPRKDHKKTVSAPSYLPTSDPGTTYGGHMVSPVATTTTTVDMDGPRRKRARIDKGSASTRAQRASARNLGAGAAPPELPSLQETIGSSSQQIPDSDLTMIATDVDEPMLSRSNSVSASHIEEPAALGSVQKRSSASRKDKGKGKEKDPLLRVKEEPLAVNLNHNEAVPVVSNLQSNEDHCSSCRSLGSLVYCDGCPRAFHLWCLDPPMEASDLPEGDSRWICPACEIQKKPPTRHSASLKFMGALLEQLETTIPVEFQLPQDIRSYFKEVSTGPNGTYVDSSEIKQPRLNRHGQLEERDPYRLKDKNGDPVLCFKCGTSALPPGIAAAAPAAKRARRGSDLTSATDDQGRSILSCDYCHLHWHLDCVDPPLACMPPWGKKWMCPNHAERILRPKHRIPRSNATPIDISKTRERNNGNVEVIQSDSAPVLQNRPAVDEVLINGRRYRIPEKVIMLEFWTKLGRNSSAIDDMDSSSITSSPLTSLSSLNDVREVMSPLPPPHLFSLEDVAVAQLLSNWRSQSSKSVSPSFPERLASDGAESEVESHMQTDNNEKSKSSSDEIVNGMVEPAPATTSTPPGGRRPGRPRKSTLTHENRVHISRRASRHGEDRDFRSRVEPSSVAPPRTRRSDARRTIAAPESASAAPEPLAPPPAQTNGLHKEPTVKIETSVHTEAQVLNEASTSTAGRPKRARHTTRRRASPVPVTSSPTASRGRNDHAQVPERTRVDASHAPEAESTPTASSLQPSLKMNAHGRSAARRRVRGSLDIASDPVDAPTAKKNAAPVPSSPSRGPGPSAAATKPDPKSDPKPTLKIRLPPPGAALSLSGSAPSASNAVAEKGRNDLSTQPRHRTRRQTSSSISMNGAFASSDRGSMSVSVPGSTSTSETSS